MPGHPLSDELAREAVETFFAHKKVKAHAAKALGLDVRTFDHRLAIGVKRGLHEHAEGEPKPDIAFPTFPDDDVSTERVIAMMSDRFEKRKASYAAHTWFPVKVRDQKPIGVLWFGDPHADDNGCNWPVLRRHTELCKTTDGLYGANIGDTTNNWAGRLIKLYANQDTSLKTARRLAEWLMLGSGVKWLVWLIGNHDQWGDGAEILARMGKKHGTQQVICHDWEARFRLVFPNGWEPRIFAAHDFPGHSMWNPLHGPMKEGQMGQDADLYVCGHKHNYAEFGFENAKREREMHFVRVRGYKFFDDYAKKLGITEQSSGCAVLTIFRPDTRSILRFSDIESGAEFLTWLRSRT